MSLQYLVAQKLLKRSFTSKLEFQVGGGIKGCKTTLGAYLWSFLQENSLKIILLLFSSFPVSAQGPVLGEQPQTIEDVFVPHVEGVEVETWVTDLRIPWELVFLPNGDALITERPGRILRIPKGTSNPVTYVEIAAHHDGDSGLMGMALHPDFERKPYVYVMYSYTQNGRQQTRIQRIKHQGTHGNLDIVLLDELSALRYHIGGRIAFGPDRMLYIGTGDVGNPPVSQDLNSLDGKILRLQPDGQIPSDNPFPNSPVFSYGHRVVQGLAWDPRTGALFNSEHGPSGAEKEGKVRHRDEINRVFAGGNYGWPKIVGAPGLEGFHDPVVMWKNNSVPPGGMTFYKEDLFVATLASQALIRIVFDEGYHVRRIERWFALTPRAGIYGRIREVTVGPDGHLYICTSNTDGRAELRPHDDKILKIKFVPSE